jgi:PAB1-binding protein PBP1
MESFVGKILEGSCSKEMIILKKHEIVTFSPNDFFCVYLRHQKKDFRTDSEISKSKDNRRNLEEWSHEGPELTLETEDRNWDQFAINHEKFGVVSTYQEELYTTKKVSPSSLSKEQLKTAHEKEKQILKGTIKEVEEEDEEKLFSAVIGSGRFQESDLLPKRERATSMASSVEFFSKDEYKRTREYLMNPQKAKKAQTVADIGVLDALDLTIAQTNNEEIILSFYKFKQEKQQPSRQDILKDFQGFSKKLEGLETKVKAKNEGLPVIHEEEVSVINVFIKNWKSFASKNSTINN